MSIVDPDIAAGAGAPGEDDAALEGAVAYCPHCASPVGEGEFPWPPEPTRCPVCEQWIGRNRASAGRGAAPAPTPADASATDVAVEEDEGHHRGRRRKGSSRAAGLLGRRGGSAEPQEEPEGGTEAPSHDDDPAPPAVDDLHPDPVSGAPPAAEERHDELPAAVDAAPSAAEDRSAEEPGDAPERMEFDEEPASDAARRSAARRASRVPRSGSLMRRSRMRRLMSTFGLAEDAEQRTAPDAPPAAQPTAGVDALPAAHEDEPPAAEPVAAHEDEPEAAAPDPAFEPEAAEAEAEAAYEDEPAAAEPVAAYEDEPAALAPEPAFEDEPEAEEPEAAYDDEPAEEADAAIAADDGEAAAAEPEAEYEDEPAGDAEPEAEPTAAAEVESEPAFADEPEAEYEDEPEAEYDDEPEAGFEDDDEPASAAEAAMPEEDPFPDEDDEQRALRAVAARVAVARMASGKAPATRIPSLPRRPQKLQPPKVTLPRRRPAPAKAEPPKRSRAGRFTGITMVVVGVLILAYGTTTLVWQDPWTAWQTARAQDRAEVEYAKIVKDFRKSAGLQTKQATRAWLHRQAALFNLNTPEGSPVGKLSIPKIDVSFTMVQGTEESTLAKGPAHYVETPLPGAKGKWTVGIAGHRTTYAAPFRRVNELSPGDKVYIRMPYAKFYYAVEKTKIVDATDETVLAADQAITGRKPYNRLALTACHPPFSAAQRIIVYARLLRYKVNKDRS